MTSPHGARACSISQKNGTPRRKPRNSGGSPIGVSAPPQFETMKMKNTMWNALMRYLFTRIHGRMSSIEAPVVPMRLVNTAPTARNTTFASGVPSPFTFR